MYHHIIISFQNMFSCNTDFPQKVLASKVRRQIRRENVLFQFFLILEHPSIIRCVQKNRKLPRPPGTGTDQTGTSGSHESRSGSRFQFNEIGEYRSSSQCQAWNRPPTHRTSIYILKKKEKFYLNYLIILQFFDQKYVYLQLLDIID